MSNLLREWMYNRLDHDRCLSEYYRIGVSDFIKFAMENGECPDGNRIRCPCIRRKCQNQRFLHVSEVELHLLSKGFVRDYYQWTSHGEMWLDDDQEYGGTSNSACPNDETSNYNYVENFHDHTYMHETFVPNYSPFQQETHIDPFQTMIRDVAGPSFQYPQESPNPSAQGFYDMMKATEQPLFEGSNHTMFEALSMMVNIKADTNSSTAAHDRYVGAFKELLPEGNVFPGNFYQTKKIIHDLGLPVEKIDACKEHCMIYWGVDSKRKKCKICNMPRYDYNGKPVAVMHYLPLFPRLQRLYQSEITASNMRWHAEHESDPDIMVHPSDSEAWKHFDRKYPSFAAETRNVRLGLMADGFTPFGVFGSQYSCWPIILTPYNLSPGMAMKEQFMFLTVLCPGPKDPGQMIDVYMQPMIAELQMLFTTGVETYDCSLKNNFRMRAALMWTISDFPAYSMLSGWVTQGRLACPYCMDKTDAFSLPHGRKTCWFDNHRKFLPKKHRYRRNIKNFTKGVVVKKEAPCLCTGEEIIKWIDALGLKRVTEVGGVETNMDINRTDGGYGWKKRSILWDLPYWKHLLIRHNLDVMHIEKNCFENIFNTVFDVKGKSKDNLKSRLDVDDICDRPELGTNSRGSFDRAYFVLGKEQKESICDWVKAIRFPDGCVSNMGRCVDMRKNKLFGMKSHDCHVFMQRLIPIAFRLTLEEKVYNVLTEFSLFFKRLTCNSISIRDMVALEEDIPVILCNLEMHFPPSFFDSMEHLPVHLPYEARIAGPVQYRWMYNCERFLGKIKRTARNKAHVEASIINSYLTEEASNFSSRYFEPHRQTKRSKIDRHDDGGQQPYVPGNLSIFTHPGRAAGKCVTRWLSNKEYKVARRYVLTNCKEVEKYLSIFSNDMYHDGWATNSVELENCIDDHFVTWFENYALDYSNIDNNEFLLALAQGPLKEVRTYPIYFVNGYVFHTKKHGSNRQTSNSGVCIMGTSDYTVDSSANDYYGVLTEVIELEYNISPTKTVLFNCDWFNISPPNFEVDKHGLVSINSKCKYRKYDPFILASQATQVCYFPYPTYDGRQPNKWWAVCKVKARSIIHITGKEGQIEKIAYQDDDQSHQPITAGDDNVPGDLNVPGDDADLALEELDPEAVMCEESDPEDDLFNDEVIHENYGD